MRSLIDITDFSVEELDGLLHTACDIIENPAKYADSCRRKKLATLFFEPSTRTRLSFEAAMLELGGSVIGFSQAQLLLRQQGGEHGRYRQDSLLLCRYHGHPPSSGGRPLCGCQKYFRAGHQCR